MTSPTKVNVLVISVSTVSSGAEFSLATMIRECVNDDISFVVATSRNERLQEMLPDDIQVKIVDFVSIVRPSGMRNFVATNWRFSKGILTFLFWARKQNIDIIYANSVKAMPYAIVLRVLLFKKLIWHSRDNISQFVAGLCSLFSTRILCVSEYVTEQIKWCQHKVSISYPFVQLRKRENDTKILDLRSSLGLPSDTILVAQIAQIVPWKNQGLSLDTVAKLKGDRAHLIIVGDSLNKEDHVYRSDLRKKVLHDDLSRKVSFIGFQPNIESILRQVDILLHPVADEPFGRVMLEAQLAGVPVVSFRSGGAKEIVRDNKTGFLVSPSFTQDLVDKVERLINNPTLRLEMGQNARKEALQKFEIGIQSRLFKSQLTT